MKKICKRQNPLVLRTTFPLTGHFIFRFGFTLIELLVAMAVGMVLVGFGTVSLNNFNENQKVEAVKQEMMSNLRLARNYAVTNQLPDTADKVFVTITSNGLMEIGFKDKDNLYISTPVLSKDVTPQGVNVVFSPSEIKFNINEGRSIDGLETITITGDDGYSKIIKIDQSGLIYEE